MRWTIENRTGLKNQAINPINFWEDLVSKKFGIIALTAVAALAAGITAVAQTPAAAPTWSVGPLDISGSIDGYYSYNANRPTYEVTPYYNQLYTFNDKTDQFALNQAKLSFSHTADPIGVQVDLIFGNANRKINNDELDWNYIEQAYVSFKPAKAKGFEADFGRFVTSAGAEVIETQNNWNYSRSLIFGYLPYDHFGLRTSMPVSKSETIGLQIVNGFNAAAYKQNNGVAFGLTSAFVQPKYTWNLNYYNSPENEGTQKGKTQLIDTTLLLTPNAKLNAYINYDYIQNRYYDGSYTPAREGKLQHAQGVAVAVHGQLDTHNSLSGRFEYTSDKNLGIYSYYEPMLVKEFTATYEYKWLEGLLTRIEYRRDWSNKNIYYKGESDTVNAQSTLTAGFVAFFGPKR